MKENSNFPLLWKPGNYKEFIFLSTEIISCLNWSKLEKIKEILEKNRENFKNIENRFITFIDDETNIAITWNCTREINHACIKIYSPMDASYPFISML